MKNENEYVFLAPSGFDQDNILNTTGFLNQPSLNLPPRHRPLIILVRRLRQLRGISSFFFFFTTEICWYSLHNHCALCFKLSEWHCGLSNWLYVRACVAHIDKRLQAIAIWRFNSRDTCSGRSLKMTSIYFRQQEQQEMNITFQKVALLSLCQLIPPSCFSSPACKFKYMCCRVLCMCSSRNKCLWWKSLGLVKSVTVNKSNIPSWKRKMC